MIYVDADACPVKPEILKVAERHGIEVTFVANSGLRPSRDPMVRNVIVSNAFDAADNWIAEHAGPGDVVVHPRAAYPTYEVGARLVGATPLASDDPAEWPAATRLVWVNSPGNPDGRVLDIAALRAATARARELGAVLASDECYAELGWDSPWDAEPVPSALDPRVTDGDVRGILSVYSLSKQSNLAGYRAAFLAGDPAIVARLLTARKHLGLMLPLPVQAAMTAALDDDEHVAAQRERYRGRRDVLKPAVEAAGFHIDGSEGGLYLWANRDPYGQLDQVPVALVVADTGAQLNGAERNLGDEVAQELIEDGAFDWHLATADEAEAVEREIGLEPSVQAGDKRDMAHLRIALRRAAERIGRRNVDHVGSKIVEIAASGTRQADRQPVFAAAG